MSLFFSHRFRWQAIALSACLVAVYWLFLASDRYISNANVVLSNPQATPPNLNFTTLLSSTSSTSSDMLLLRDYLLSVDMFLLVKQKADFNNHYTDRSIDWLSRLRSKDLPLEKQHRYYTKRVTIALDDYASILRISVEAFTPEKAKEIADLLIMEGEAYMNIMGQNLASQQIDFFEKQAESYMGKLERARASLLAYQDDIGLGYPSNTAESVIITTTNLESQLSELEAQKRTLAKFQKNNSPQLVNIENNIEALSAQLAKERSKLSGQSDDTLNKINAEYRLLEMQLEFAEQAYQAITVTLEQTRAESIRKLKQISIVQTPTLPEYSAAPQRVRNIAIYTSIVIFLGLIIQMIILVIEDHKD